MIIKNSNSSKNTNHSSNCNNRDMPSIRLAAKGLRLNYHDGYV